jgi:hypothetical protein
MESLIEKIRKLIAHARSARDIGSLAEAEAFAARIQALLIQHKISMSEIDTENRDAGDPIGHSYTNLTTKTLEKWVNALAFGIGTNYFCKIVGEISRRNKARIAFVGREADRLAAAGMFDYLHFQAVRLARNYLEAKTPSIAEMMAICEAQSLRPHPRVLVSLRKKLQREARADYLLGFAAAIQARLTESKKALEAGPSSTTALILHDRAAIERYAAEAFDITIRKSDREVPRFKDHAAARAGFSAGSNVSLSPRPALVAGTCL